jgi:hypothetical protein
MGGRASEKGAGLVGENQKRKSAETQKEGPSSDSSDSPAMKKKKTTIAGRRMTSIAPSVRKRRGKQHCVRACVNTQGISGPRDAARRAQRCGKGKRRVYQGRVSELYVSASFFWTEKISRNGKRAGPVPEKEGD